jgi:predicted amidohydrolase
VVADARRVDVALAMEHRIPVVRADVAGRTDGIVAYGSSAIVDPRGTVLQSAQPLTEDLIVADLEISPREPGAIR